MWTLFSIACIYPKKNYFVCFNFINKYNTGYRNAQQLPACHHLLLSPFLRTTVSVLLRCGFQSDTTTNLQEMQNCLFSLPSLLHPSHGCISILEQVIQKGKNRVLFNVMELLLKGSSSLHLVSNACYKKQITEHTSIIPEMNDEVPVSAT